MIPIDKRPWRRPIKRGHREVEDRLGIDNWTKHGKQKLEANQYRESKLAESRKVVKDLNGMGISAEAIHGNKSQGARERALKGFKNRTIRILVATDIASRGIDVDKLSHVINYEIPEQAETYVHRIGRTGRAGASGVAMSFCAQDEMSYLKDINKLIKKNIEVVSTHPFN